MIDQLTLLLVKLYTGFIEGISTDDVGVEAGAICYLLQDKDLLIWVLF